MAVTQIIGPRIKPMWADPVEWTSTRAYDDNTYVTYQGDSYATRQPTPIGIQITNTAYWVKISEFNAQAVAMQNSVNHTLEANETATKNMLKQGTQDITAIKNEAEQSINTGVAQVNKVAAQFQTQLDNVQILTTDSTKYLLIFGDSWSGANEDGSWAGANEGAGEAQRWWHTIADQMQLSVLNYALGGSRFGGTTDRPRFDFKAQLDKAKSEITAEVKRNITYVIIFGGINDLLSSQYTANYAQFANRVYNFASQVKEWLPKAKINVIAPNAPRYNCSSYTTVSQSASNYFFAPVFSRERLNTLGVAYYDPRYWLFGYDAYVSDNVHPNAQGHQIIASKMLGILNNNLQEKTADTWWTQNTSGEINSQVASVSGVPINEETLKWTSSYTFDRGLIKNRSSLYGFSAAQNTWAYGTIEIPNHYLILDSFEYDTSLGVVMLATEVDNKIQIQCKAPNVALASALQIRAVLYARLG